MNTFVNFYQTPDERRAKYALARLLFTDSRKASRYRDLRWTTIVELAVKIGIDRTEIDVSVWRKYAPYMHKNTVRRVREICNERG